MKIRFWVFFIFFLETFFMVGCSSQSQLTMTLTVIPKQTNTLIPSATPNPLSTYTSSPPLPTIPPPPLPKGIFEPFQESVFDPTTLHSSDDIIKTAFGVVRQNSMVEEKVFVDSTMGYVVFSLFWEKGDLDLILIQPDGKEINPSMAEKVQDFNVYPHALSFISAFGRERYCLIYPLVGEWTMKIFGKSTPSIGSNYMIQITSRVATGIRGNFFDKEEYSPSSPIKFSFSITDSTSGSILAPPGYIHGVSMHVTAETPNKEYYTFELYDDGLHDDDQADDGIYGNIFNNTLVTGKYNFYVQTSGINNRAKEPFTREYYFSTTVK